MAKQYKIGDVAKLLGITPEAIRYYEEQGIISPVKSQTNGYRYYGVWDIHLLIRTRVYRQLGYSLAEAADLINHRKADDIVGSLKTKESDIEATIFWNMNLLKHIRHMQQLIQDAQAMVDKYRLEYRPPLYRIDGQKGYELHADSFNWERYHEWIEKVPFVFPSALFRKSAIENGQQDFSFGLMVEGEYAELQQVRESNLVAFYPPRLSLHTTLITSSDMILTPQHLEPAIRYLHSLGMKLKADVVSRVVLMNKREGHYYSWHQLWLPIE